MQELKRAIGEVAFSLVYYANIYCNPSIADDSQLLETQREIRTLAAKLRSLVDQIVYYNKFRCLFSLPDHSEIREASANLIGLSNIDRDEEYEHIKRRVEDIKDNLGIFEGEKV